MANTRVVIGNVLMGIPVGAISALFVFLDTHALLISIIFGLVVGCAAFFQKEGPEVEWYRPWSLFVGLVLAGSILFFSGYGTAVFPAMMGMVVGVVVGVIVFLVLELLHIIK